MCSWHTRRSSRRTRYTLRSITINFKYKYQRENAIKNSCHLWLWTRTRAIEKGKDYAWKNIQISFIRSLTIDVFNSNVSYWQDRRVHDLNHYTLSMQLFYSLRQPRDHSFCLFPKINSSCTTVEITCQPFFLTTHVTKTKSIQAWRRAISIHQPLHDPLEMF